METTHRALPRARTEKLVTQQLADEVLIYDLERHRAHSLNRAAALIWRHCNGSTPVAEIAQRLQQELGTPVKDEAIWLVLNRLSRAHLLQERVQYPAAQDRSTRRVMLRHMAAVGGVALVSSIVVPGAMAATIAPECISGPTTCCGSPNCTNNNACKCCFIPPGSTICSGDCGATCQSMGGTCFQLSNNVC
jgi:hypothetical protein